MAKKINPFVEFLINSLASSLETVGSMKLVEVLQTLHDGEVETWEACLKSGYAFVQPLKKMVSKTKTKIDDGFVDALEDAIAESAQANGLVLS
jgi:hypothetical protein